MTYRLYYDQCMLKAFEAEVTKVKEEKGEYYVSLNRSAFYPTSGGQPYDTGIMTSEHAQVRVLEVEEDKEGEVWHRVDTPLLPGERVSCTIDWERRLDHMQQHGGEHMLAGAIWRQLKGRTIGLHTGHEDATIDVEMPDGRTRFTEEEIKHLEDTVNEEIREDVPVRCWFPEPAELARLPLRKPPTVSSHVRVVAFGDFEYCACGGTHPTSTGKIGVIKILSVIPSKGKARVTFVCGKRAFDRLQSMFEQSTQACACLSCREEQLAQAVEQQKNLLAQVQRSLLAARLENALQQARTAEKTPEILADGTHVFCLSLVDADAKALQECAAILTKNEKAIALCVSKNQEKELVLFARSGDVKQDILELLRLSGVRGGGKADFAQGSIQEGDALNRALEILRKV